MCLEYGPLHIHLWFEKRNQNCDSPPQAKSEKWSEDQYLKWETDRQLEMQQNALNGMTAKDYEKGRELFKQNGRGNGLDQVQARQNYEKDLADSKFEANLETMDPISARKKANQDSKDIMSTMAALHNPDQISAGIMSDAPMDMGLKNVNSSIGSGWGNKAAGESLSRVDSIDNAVKDVDPNLKDATKLNVKLERCK